LKGAALLCGLLLATGRSAAQVPPAPGPEGGPVDSARAEASQERPARQPWTVWASARLGGFAALAAERSWDAVYGGPLALAGVGVEADLRSWFVAFSADHGRARGEQVLPTEPPLHTGIPVEIRLLPLHLTAGWVTPSHRRWQARLGGGPTLLLWREETAAGGDRQSDGGAHLMAALRRNGRRWATGVELRWSTVPGAIGEGGLSRLYDEDDLGGLAAQVTALYRLR
jgi:hypothetical protein